MVIWEWELLEGKGVDVRKKVEDAIPREKAQVAADFELLCNSVHLKRLPDESNNSEKAQQCS